jgi:hypothetical protein
MIRSTRCAIGDVSTSMCTMRRRYSRYRKVRVVESLIFKNWPCITAGGWEFHWFWVVSFEKIGCFCAEMNEGDIEGRRDRWRRIHSICLNEGGWYSYSVSRVNLGSYNESNMKTDRLRSAFIWIPVLVFAAHSSAHKIPGLSVNQTQVAVLLIYKP